MSHSIEIEEDILSQMCIMNVSTMEILLQEKNAVDLISLYMFYYRQCKIQKTNQSWTTNSFVSKWLKISEDRISKASNKLKELWLIEFIQENDWSFWKRFIKLRYLISRTWLNAEPEICGTGDSGTNAWRVLNINAWRDQNEMLKCENEKNENYEWSNSKSFSSYTEWNLQQESDNKLSSISGSRIKEKQELTLEQVKTEYQNKKLMEYIFFLIRDTNFQDTVTLKQYQKYYDHILKAFFIVYGWDKNEAAKNRDYIFHTIDDMRKFYALRPNKPIKSFCWAINTWVQNSLKFNNQK